MNPQQILNFKQKITKCTQARDYEGAARLALKIVEANPKDIEVWWALVQLQERLGQIEAAIKSCYQVCQGPSPVYAQAVEKAVQLATANEFWALGVAPAQELVKLHPKSADAWSKLGGCWHELRHYENAAVHFEKALECDPTHSFAGQKLTLCYMYTLRQKEALALLEKRAEMGCITMIERRYLAFASNYPDGLDEQSVMDQHRRYVEHMSQEKTILPVAKVPNYTRTKKRLGFVSEDFRVHSVGFYFLALIEHFNFEDWEVYCYSCAETPDRFTKMIEGYAEHWREVNSLDHDELLECIQKDELDVLVDLQGLTGNTRISVFLSRLATVQVAYLGYPNTTGLESIDFRLTDAVCDPEGQSGAGYSEKLFRMDQGFLCFRPEGLNVETVDLPALSNGYVTFACFNAFQKVTPEMLDTWSEILLNVPDSRMLIKSRPLVEDELKEKVFAHFEAKGVARQRIELMDWTATKDDHMRLYNRVDIHLDTYPYNGTTTSCESFWQGVPIVTRAGNSHRSRVGLSLLSQLDLQEWAADTREGYIHLAISKAGDLEALGELRSSLRSRLQSSSLMDELGFAKRFESAVSEMLAEVKAGLD